MKKSILISSAGFIFGVLATLFMIWNMAPGIMMREDVAKYNFETSVARFQATVKKLGWSIPAVHDLQKTMKKFGHDVRKVKVFELCHPDHAFRILKQDDERIVSSLMPCRVALYQKSDGKTYISRMNTGLMGKMMSGIIPEVMGHASKESEIIINSVLD